MSAATLQGETRQQRYERLFGARTTATLPAVAPAATPTATGLVLTAPPSVALGQTSDLVDDWDTWMSTAASADLLATMPVAATAASTPTASSAGTSALPAVTPGAMPSQIVAASTVTPSATCMSAELAGT